VQKCAILMLQIDKQHVWLMEWASEWVTGWASEWMNEWTNGWIGWDGVDSNGWSVQRVWGNGNQCNVYADAGTWDPKIGGQKTGTPNQIQILIQDHKLLSIMLHATVLPFLCLIVDVSPLASFYPPPLTIHRIRRFHRIHLGHVSCSVLMISVCDWSGCFMYLSCDCGNCTLDSTIIVPIIAIQWNWRPQEVLEI